jgi:pyruvate,water dikinase
VRLLGADATGAEVSSVLRGLPHNVTTAMDLDLWRLAQRIRADAEAAQSMRDLLPDRLAGALQAGTLPRTLQHGLTGFLAAYGHRSVAEVDLGVPRWADDPRYVFGVLANYLRLEDTSLAPDAVFRRSAEEAEAMVAALTGRARRRSRLRALAVGFALGRARQLAGVRELPKACLVRVLAVARAEIAAAGTHLAGAGRLEAADDVFFLDLAEAHRGIDGADLRPLVAHRRERFAQELRRTRVPRVLLSDGTEPEATAPVPADIDGRSLRGTPASAGIVAGVARVVLDPLGARLDPGEILVAPSTDPGWTPLFLTAGGLVMEMGGANSHGAVVAREYGIPAVVGVAGATDRITSGDTISIDGAAGMVTIEPEPPRP